MASKLTLWVPKLTANRDSRTLSGRLLPFNEPGFTNLGKIIASADSKIDVASDVILNIEHDSKRPIGKAAALTAASDGIDSAFSVLATRDGDDALTEADAGLRCGLSVEMEPVVIRAGKLISGTITGAGLVTRPAFDSARLAAADAPVVPDMGEVPTDKTDATLPEVDINGQKLDGVTDVTVTDTKIDIKTDAPAPADAETKDENMAAANATITNAALIAANATKKTADKNKLFAALAGANAVGPNASMALAAALSDIVPGDILGIEQPQAVGQLWNGAPYERKIVPLYNHGDLTSFKVQGWRWVTKPEVGDYAGDKADVPSNEVETESVEIDAYRLAGAHDIDRKFRDFSSTEFWDAYYAAMTESTKKKSDIKVRNIVTAAATRVHLLTGAAPAGVPTALWQIVEGVAKIVDTLEVIPDHALVTTDYWKPLLFTKAQDVLVYLDAMLGFTEGTLAANKFQLVPVPVGSLNLTAAQTGGSAFTGKVLVGCKPAVTVHELGGEAPIRIEAPNVGQGGIDSGVFYYGAVNVHDSDGLVLFDAPSAN